MNKIVINAVGDVWFGDHPLCLGYGVNSISKHKSDDYFFKYVKDILLGDINFCNLETVLSDVNYIPDKLDSVVMRGQNEHIKFLKYANFNVVNVANNHMMQHGAQAFFDTINNLKFHNISVVGFDKRNDNKTHIHQHNKGGSTVLFAGYSLHEDTYTKEKIRYSYRSSCDDIVNEIRNIKLTKNDIIICSLHWGDEFIDYPSKEQIYFAHELIDCGVNVVLGHHPHVIQPIEKYKDGLIAYSLGNFLFDLWGEKTKESIILNIEFKDNSLDSFLITDVYINSLYQPVPVLKSKQKIIFSEKSNILSYFNYTKNDNYNKKLSKEQKKFKIEGYFHFFRNLNKYNVKFLSQLLVTKTFGFINKIFKKLGLN